MLGFGLDSWMILPVGKRVAFWTQQMSLVKRIDSKKETDHSHETYRAGVSTQIPDFFEALTQVNL